MGSPRSLLLDKPRYDRDEAEFGRAVGFIDATYALALTLLVTSLEVHDFPSSWTSVGALYDAVGEQFVTFLIAFAVIASYWLEHQRMFAWFSAIDYPVIVANLFLICAIVLLPFSTRSVGDPSDIDELALPTVVMAVNVTVCSILQTGVYALAVRRGLVRGQPSALAVRRGLVRGQPSALADPTRRAILARLAEGEATVSELAEPFPMTLQGVSKHLKVLERAGLVARGRTAQLRPSRLQAPALKEAADWLAGYRGFWEGSFDRLGDHLAEMQEGSR